MSSELTAAVTEALEEIRAAFRSHRVHHEPDGQGGAFVRVEDLDLGRAFSPATSWVAFQITFQYPFADVYPHYLRHDLVRTDGQAFTPPLHPNHPMTLPNGATAPAVMISRRSNQRDPETDTAATKLAKVLDWLRAQS
jgi:hypothetical protein